jgi:hypothetical protein
MASAETRQFRSAEVADGRMIVVAISDVAGTVIGFFLK